MTVREIPVKVWRTTDATLDNVAAVERVGGDADIAANADRLRQRGWRAAAEHPRRGQGHFGWPPDDDALAIDMTPIDLDFVREVLARSRLLTRDVLNDLGVQTHTRLKQEDSLRLENEAIRYWDN